MPTFELGDLFEDQYVCGAGLDLTNDEQLTVIAGESSCNHNHVVIVWLSCGYRLAIIQ